MPRMEKDASTTLTNDVIVSLIITCVVIFNLLVVIGNGFVICTILLQPRLHTITNIFILSLAVSDLLLGLVVLPSSAANEILQHWPFDVTWCRIWLAVDVWLCTSSILNLCAISLDRFVAIRWPLRYPQLVTALRAKLLIAAIWMLAFLICCPPLFAWSEFNSYLGMSTSKESRVSNLTCQEHCTMSNTTFNCSSPTESHRQNQTDADCRLKCSIISQSSYVIYSALGSFWIPMCFMVFFNWNIYRTATLSKEHLRRGVVASKMSKSHSTMKELTLRAHRGGNRGMVQSYQTINSPRQSQNRINEMAIVDMLTNRRTQINVAHLADVVAAHRRLRSRRNADFSAILPVSGSPVPSSWHYCVHTSRSGRLLKERRAAKTVGLIVGCFILCWAPFFTVYLIRAFCLECIHPVIFIVFFWLGYANSAVNPFIYGLCNKDFKRAYRRMIRCTARDARLPVRSALVTLIRNSFSGVAIHSLRV